MAQSTDSHVATDNMYTQLMHDAQPDRPLAMPDLRGQAVQCAAYSHVPDTIITILMIMIMIMMIIVVIKHFPPYDEIGTCRISLIRCMYGQSQTK